MANTITRQTLCDGSRVCVLHFYIKGDGSGEENNTILVDFSALLDNGDKTNVKVLKIISHLSEFEAELAWKGTPNIPFIELNSTASEYCFEDIGGLINNAVGSNGDIVISTVGLSAGDSGFITLVLNKRN